MTIKADSADVCWEIIDLATGGSFFEGDDFQPHYATRAACAARIADLHSDRDLSIDGPLHLVAQPCYGGPCVLLVCDGCGYVFDEDEYTTHFDPADPFPIPITDYDWTVERRAGQPERHYCPGDECRPRPCDECGGLHNSPECPDPSWQPVPAVEGQQEISW